MKKGRAQLEGRGEARGEGRRPAAIRVRLPGRKAASYPIVIGPGALEGLPALLRGLGPPSRLHIVTDRRVWGAGGTSLSEVLESARLPWARTTLPSGERTKSARWRERIWSDVVRAGCDRRSLLLAFGGGVVGDIAGFAAATVLRGIDFMQIPTTLLAMVDASVGGKTGINLPEGKNLVGSFHQPRAVVMDLDLLETLPARELRAGWAEVVKTAAIRDGRLFELLDRDRERLLRREPAALGRVVAACVRIKADVVERDERESGLRMVLNFGHTLAHALEADRGYGRLLHGEAVAIGMAFAARLGEGLGKSAQGTAERLEALLDVFGLPRSLEGGAGESLLAAMERDKKRGPRGLRWVLLDKIGRARVAEDVSPRAVRRALEEFAGGGAQSRGRSRARS